MTRVVGAAFPKPLQREIFYAVYIPWKRFIMMRGTDTSTSLVK